MISLVKISIWVLAIAVGVYLALLVYLYLVQKSMVFFPSKELVISPQDMNLYHEELNLEIDSKTRIHGWYLPIDSAACDKVILFCHGNGGNISHRGETIWFFNRLQVPGVYFDYRGYGHSTGELSEEGLYEDVRAVYNWLVEEKKYKPENIILFGRSLGGAVAVDLASKVKVGGLIIESSFTSAVEVGQKSFPYFPVKLLMKYKFDSYDKINRVACPKLFIHSQDDDIILYELGKKLYEAAPEPKQFFEIDGFHNDQQYLQTEAYKTTIKQFLQLDSSFL